MTRQEQRLKLVYLRSVCIEGESCYKALYHEATDSINAETGALQASFEEK